VCWSTKHYHSSQVEGTSQEEVDHEHQFEGEPEWEGLRDSIAGGVVLPGSPAYESTRKPATANFRDI
jgi:hypothetical protein